jgi:hypothetical protein
MKKGQFRELKVVHFTAMALPAFPLPIGPHVFQRSGAYVPAHRCNNVIRLVYQPSGEQ